MKIGKKQLGFLFVLVLTVSVDRSFAGEDKYPYGTFHPIPGPLEELPRPPNRIEFPPGWDPERPPRAQRVPVRNPVARPQSQSLEDIMRQLEDNAKLPEPNKPPD